MLSSSVLVTKLLHRFSGGVITYSYYLLLPSSLELEK